MLLNKILYLILFNRILVSLIQLSLYFELDDLMWMLHLMIIIVMELELTFVF